MYGILNDVIQPVKVVRDLSVYLDNELTMKLHNSRVFSSCFFQLRRLRQIRRSAGEEVTKRMVTALMLSRLDYCNGVLAGLPESTIRPLQRVQISTNFVLVSSMTPSQGTTSLQWLMRLHWLPIKSRNLYKLCLLMHLIHSDLPTWPRGLNSLQHLRRGLGYGLPVISCTRSQR